MPRCRNTRRRSRVTGAAFLFRTGLIAAALLVPGACGLLAQQALEPIIGRAGGSAITEREFVERFELTPGLYRNRRAQLDEQKLIVAYSLVAEKLLAQEALARGLDGEKAYQKSLGELRKLLARDELYYREVRQQISVSQGEISLGMQRARRELHVHYLFFSSEEEARFVRSLIRTPQEFLTMAIDSSIDVVRDTATVIWGDADTPIEDAAYTIEQGAISPVVTAGDGYYLLYLDRDRPSAFYSSLPEDVLRERVSSTIRQRKERKRTREVMGTILRGKDAYSPPEAFRELAAGLRDLFLASKAPYAVSPAIASALKATCAKILLDTVIVAGGRSWTVAEAIDELEMRGFVVQNDPERRTGRRLYEAFQEWVEQELLAQEALRRGLDNSPQVARRLAPWQDQLLASLMKDRVAQGVSVSNEEILRFLRSRDSTAGLPLVRLRELHVPTIEMLNAAAEELEQGISFEALVQKLTGDPSLQTSGGLTELFPVAERPSLGAIAWDMEPGDRYGPVADSSGFLMFELVEKTRARAGDEHVGREQARQEILRMKRQRRLTLFLSGVGATRGYQVYDDQVIRTNVSPVPMLAFRLLGFGGRMFAVPFVDRQIEWLMVDPPQDVLVP